MRDFTMIDIFKEGLNLSVDKTEANAPKKLNINMLIPSLSIS